SQLDFWSIFRLDFCRAVAFAGTIGNRPIAPITMSTKLMDAYERMFAKFGPQRWWPGDSPFEIVVGAVLVQNTAWRNVERAIDNLRAAGVMEPHALYNVQPAELAELIRPAGYYQVKTKRLRNLL